MIDVPARPASFPLAPGHTALVVIDMQRDFIEPGGHADSVGHDVERVAEIVPTIARLIATFRRRGWAVVHTREAHLPDLSDCPPAKLKRGGAGLKIGDKGDLGRLLVRDEPGTQIVRDLAPLPDEIVIDKPGKGMFFDTGLHVRLSNMGITHLVFAGATTESGVQASMREATDRGYECLLIEDATGSYWANFKAATIEMIVAQVGWVASFSELRTALAMELIEPEPTGPEE